VATAPASRQPDNSPASHVARQKKNLDDLTEGNAMPRALLAAPLLLLSSMTIAQRPQPAAVTVDLANFKYTPSAIQLRAGVPTVMRFRNSSGGAHNFTAPAFFAAARMQPNAAALVRNGRVEVPGRATVELKLVPAAGKFPVKCTHTLHSAFGMKGTIFVR
jgi:plastocyanin